MTLPDTEIRKLVDQKAQARFARVESYLIQHRALFATQGAVVATWRTYRGRRLGPYFQVSYREGSRQRSMYLGGSRELADRVREVLGRIQWRRKILRRRRLKRRPILRLLADARAAFRESKDELRKELARWGITLKGWEFRGVRRAFKNPLPHFFESMARRYGVPPSAVGGSSFFLAHPPKASTDTGPGRRSDEPFFCSEAASRVGGGSQAEPGNQG